MTPHVFQDDSIKFGATSVVICDLGSYVPRIPTYISASCNRHPATPRILSWGPEVCTNIATLMVALCTLTNKPLQ